MDKSDSKQTNRPPLPTSRRNFVRACAMGAAAIAARPLLGSAPTPVSAKPAATEVNAAYPAGGLHHRGRVGAITFHVLHDGAEGDWARNVLLLETPGGLVLLEAGNGDNILPRGFVPDRLAALGIRPEDIRAVLLSHADWDHIGGTIQASGEPVFPNAVHVLPRAEIEFWRDRPERMRLDAPVDLDFRRIANVVPVQRVSQLKGRLRLSEPGEEIWPGIRSHPLPGHCPGYTYLEIENGGERLVYVGDMIFDPAALADPDWVAPYDRDPAEVRRSRRKLLSAAAARQDLLLAYHVTFPGLGRVAPAGAGFAWTPSPTGDATTALPA